MRRVLLILSVLAAVLLPTAGPAQAAAPCTVGPGTFFAATSHHYNAVDASFPRQTCSVFTPHSIFASLQTWNGSTWVTAKTPFWQVNTMGGAVFPTRFYVTATCLHPGNHVRVLVAYWANDAVFAKYLTNYAICS